MSEAGAVRPNVVDVLVFRPVLKGWLVLALQRALDTRCPGSWEMVHGKVEAGEAAESAARRELHEETGLEAVRLLSVKMHHFYLMPAQSVQLAAVFLAVVAPDAKVVLGPEHGKHVWLTPSQARRRFTWPEERRSLDDARVLLAATTVHDSIEQRRS